MARPTPCPASCTVLLVGGGGREHALAWKLRQSPRCGRLWLTDTSNAALRSLGDACPVPMDMSNVFRMRRWCDEAKVDLVVVGPEAPLAAGLADALAADGRFVFGPSQAAARIEADKAWAKKLMRQAAVPTAEARFFEDVETARSYAQTRQDGCVVKASGLAAGKGVIVCDTVGEAMAAIDRTMIAREFGDAGNTIIIEEKITGQEVSVLALVDGCTLWILDPCQDHKQLMEGDTGPNTGGMGAYCPTPLLDDRILATIEREIFVPTVDALRRDGIEYRGVLYAGLMLTPGGPKVLEFNCRFGDPECQPLMMRLRGDLVELLWATAAGGLDQVEVAFDPRVACCVVVCSGGYPGRYRTGHPIGGIEAAESSGPPGDVVVFHAGTTLDDRGRIVTNGGRVLSVTALGDDLRAARDLANEACAKIDFEGAYHRKDIGDRVLGSRTTVV